MDKKEFRVLTKYCFLKGKTTVEAKLILMPSFRILPQKTQPSRIDTLKVSTQRVHHIIHENLGMRKICAKWGRRVLTFDQKQRRLVYSEQCLKMIKRNKPEFLRGYATMVETWLYHFTPKSNRQSSKWNAYDEAAPKCGKIQQSAGKFMASIFWDANRIIFIGYLEKGINTNSDYYIALLDHLKNEIAEK
ncbi:hypothetical protein GWI33_016369 [Rhynchophorus ferrugineus]|uniref:Transposase n=1 Tax=Rhynchophorus ferrugineus TaxID=354439 RepID=A0A834I1V0_RHYFE|nr:hypothetical protein GWI33_016369 [Rhynchophorus ferrugineus]